MFVWIITVLLAGVLLLIFRVFVNRKRMVDFVDLLPGPPGLPLVGNLFDFAVPHNESVKKIIGICDNFGRDGIVRLWLGHRGVVFLYSPKWVEALLSSTSVISKATEYRFLHPWLGTGLLTSTGEKWHSRRKLLTPAFHFRILEEFMDVHNEQAQVLVQQLQRQVGGAGQSKVFDVFPFVARCTLDIICETAMGRHMNAQTDRDSAYVQAVNRMTDVIHHRQLRPWLWPACIFHWTQGGRDHQKCLSILHSFTKKVIRERRAEWVAKGRPPTDSSEDPLLGKKIRLAFLDLLLEASDDGRVLSDTDIREEVDTFMFEGHDTTAAGISWALYLLGRHPEIQEKVHDELDKVLGTNSHQTCKVTSEDLKKLKYLECTIKEALRLFPPVPAVGRHSTEDLTIDGVVIPAGVTVVVLNYLLHRDPKHFPDPETFNPDRFLVDNSVGRHPYAYVPFSAGPRNCIGQKFVLMEEKVVLAHLLRSYSIESVLEREDVVLLPEIILRVENGIQVRLKQRPRH